MINNNIITKPLKVVKADDWTELFNRVSGWLGADGVYSIPINAPETKIGSATKDTITFWTFCDTFHGEIDTATLRWKDGPHMGHNTAAILHGTEPDPDKIEFFYGHKASMTYGKDMKENSLYGYAVWPQDGILLDDAIYLTSFRVDDKMAPCGGDMIKIPLVDGHPDFENYAVFKDVGTFYQEGEYEIVYGGGILDNTKEAGAPFPDGYVYIYGTRNTPKAATDKQLIVARVKKEDFIHVDRWEFYDGTNWIRDISVVDSDSASMAARVSNELSVTPIDSGIYKGKYMLIYSVGSYYPQLEYRVSDTPYGPFSEPVKFYDTPEPDIYKDALIYNAKAHPHLSKPGELLISYNVNLWLVFPDTSEVYRPRFLRLKLDEFADEAPKSLINGFNVALNKEVFASHSPETARYAVDGRWERDEENKWFASSEGDKWLIVDLDGTFTIDRWVVKHASYCGEPTAYNTKDYKLQYSMDNENWTDADAVEYNVAPFTDRIVEPFEARFVRLYITKPSQGTDNSVRIYQFEVYGKKADQTK